MNTLISRSSRASTDPMLGPEQDAPSFVHADWGGSACDIGLYSSRKRHVRESPADRSGCQLAFQAVAKPTFKTPKGTRDILPGEADRQRALVNTFGEAARRAGYGHVMTPMFEDLGVFKRLGEATDVVTKEMYDFEAKDGKRYALRPELTASVVRAFVQHRPLIPWKVWYEGPQFRYERPQAGRYRQFSQVGVEALGTDDPAIDAEIIALAWDFYATLGLRQVTLMLNSLGDATCRPAYLDALTAYFNDNLSSLSEQSQYTLQVNPLRVLDSKRPEDQAVIDAAPIMVDFSEPGDWRTLRWRSAGARPA